MIFGLLLACKHPPVPPIGEDACGPASEVYGERLCVHEVDDRATWDGITVDGEAVDQRRTTKYMVPAVETAELPPLFVDVNTIYLHYDFLVQGFPDLFSGLSFDGYIRLVLDPEDREYFSGNVTEYLDPSGTTFFGFTVWDDPAVVSSTVSEAQVQAVWEQIQPRFGLATLVFVPNSSNQRAAVRTWGDTPFEIRGTGDWIAYEAYTVGVGYGTLRAYSLAELQAATEDGSFGWQDVLALDEAPFDIERPISGAVTGTRQGELSHLNIRSAARGTPNCFVRDPRSALGLYEGQLVRFECGATAWSVAPATIEDAEAFWASIRPDPVLVPEVDLSVDALVPLLDLPTATAEEREIGLRRYGSKGRNLATLYQRIPSDLQIDGFLVPFAGYDDFVHTATWTVDLGAGAGEHSFAETLAAWEADPAFATDGALRGERLDDLTDAMRDAPVDPTLEAAVAVQIEATFGGDTAMVRFRSSSNAEDSLEFSGAGLYDSTSVCLADDRDTDDDGPSRCDPDEPDERPVSRGLKKVWSSLWNLRAWEERAWYGIDQSKVEMAVLVDTRAKDEQVNIVAFSGNPIAADDRYLVNAQLGAWDVVSADPGVWPESELLDVQDGEVVEIVRVSRSSQAEQVMTDTQLRELGAAFYDVVEVYPVDAVAPAGHTVLLDTEWKVLADGRLVIKQVRPYLR